MNIVSIDFDIIMAPSIEFYNNFTHDRYLFDNPLLKVCNADLEHYRKLTTWFFKNLKNVNYENVIFIKSHEQAVNYINKGDTLINIDHHHDLGYKKEEDIKPDEPKCHCGNWVKYLFDNNIISDYIWINNKNSTQPLYFNGKIEQCAIEDYNLDSLTGDKVIICLSPEWVPPQFHPLFYSWMDICGKGFNTIHIEFK